MISNIYIWKHEFGQNTLHINAFSYLNSPKLIRMSEKFRLYWIFVWFVKPTIKLSLLLMINEGTVLVADQGRVPQFIYLIWLLQYLFLSMVDFLINIWIECRSFPIFQNRILILTDSLIFSYYKFLTPLLW